MIPALSIILLSGCAELNTLMQSLPADVPLTEADVAKGLKEALVLGSKNSSTILSAVDGYYWDELVKILLPEEASIIIDNIGRIPDEKEKITIGSYAITIEEKDGNRIKEYIVKEIR